MKRFGSLAKIRAAGEEELAATPGIGPELASAIHRQPDRRRPRAREALGVSDDPVPGGRSPRGSPSSPGCRAPAGPRPRTAWRTSGTSSSTTSRRRCCRRWPSSPSGRAARPGSRSWWTPAAASSSGSSRGALAELRDLGIDYRIVFLEASDDDLVNRYEATRRRHPLAPAGRVIDGIRKERQMMAQLRGEADLVIDTSGLSPHALRDRVRAALADQPRRGRAAGLGPVVRVQVRAAARRRHPARRPVPAEPALGPRAPPAPRHRPAGPRVRPRPGGLRPALDGHRGDARRGARRLPAGGEGVPRPSRSAAPAATTDRSSWPRTSPRTSGHGACR